MAAVIASVAAPVVCAMAVRPANKQVAAKKAFSGVSNKNIAKTSAFQVWTPINNKFFETFSFLPPLSNDQISKQVDYIVRNGYTPCLEFADASQAYISNENTVRMSGGVTANYYDNRYWTMWKLPMFGCQSGDQVIGEVTACTKAFPDAYIRLVAFDAVRQVQITGFLVHRPASASDFQAPDARSVQ